MQGLERWIIALTLAAGAIWLGAVALRWAIGGRHGLGLSDALNLAVVLGAMLSAMLLAVPRPERVLRPPPRPEICRVAYVYDGDTVAVDCGNGEETARLQGFNTPETRGAECEAERRAGQDATERLRELVASGPVRITLLGYEKYGRRLIRLRVGPQGEDVADIMVREGLAERYAGGARRNWCAELGR